MEMHEIIDQNFDLKDAIITGGICPDGAVDALVWTCNRKLDIRLHKFFESEIIPKKMILFFWDYAGGKPYVVRACEVKNNCISLEVDKSLLLQMKLLHLSSVRIAIAFQLTDEYFCGYIRNHEAKNEEVLAIDRSICKLASVDKQALVAYWTESGILSVMFRDEKKFDDEFYRIKLSGYYWENERLTAYLEMPLMMGAAKISMCSASTDSVCRSIGIRLEKAGAGELKAVWKMTIDLSGMPSDDADGYRLLCELDGHLFGIFMDSEIDEDDYCRITLQSGGTLEACVVREKDGKFLLKTGKVYPAMLSVVTAVYNTAPFLAEMIHSVLSQNLGKLKDCCRDYRRDYYKKIFEFILVDDGSTDGSGDILDDYARISDKIKVIHKENGGVSSARNAGMEIAQGKYITFPDSDDKLSENYMEESLLFFEANQDKLTVVKTPMNFFDEVSGAHWANYQFTKENRIVNPWKEPSLAFHNVSSCIFKSEELKTRKFDVTLAIGEDMLFVNDTLITAGRELYNVGGNVGLIGKVSYYYRKRALGEGSAMDNLRFKEDSYIGVLKNVFEKILLRAKEEFGYVPKWVQYSVMGQLQWRFSTSDRGKTAKEVLGNDKFLEYKNLALSMLHYIDDDVIVSQRKIWAEHFYYMLMKKYNKQPELIKENNDIYFRFNETRIVTPFSRCYVRLDFLQLTNNRLHIDGFAMNFDARAELYIYVNGKPVQYHSLERDVNKYTFDDIVFYATTFSADISLKNEDDKYEVEFRGRLDGTEIVKREIRYSKTMPLAGTYKKSYYMKGEWTVRKEGHMLIVYNMSAQEGASIDFEQEFEDEINKSKSRDIVSDVLSLRKQALSRLAVKNGKKKIWLLSDRIAAANDNGEALFRYLNRIKDSDIEAYYVIDADCSDYERMKEYGRVVPYGSKQYMILQLIADYIVSSAGDDIVTNPWHTDVTQSDIIRDLLVRPKYIFLQHGVIINDLSEWLNRYNKNITGFVCTAQREAQSIEEYNYYYKPKNVWLTGLPRHDRLYHDEKNYITIMPTWRHWLTKKQRDSKSGEEFLQSEYYRFYNKLINCGKLLDAAEHHGYTICFMPHPNVRQVIGAFRRDKRVKFFTSEKPYNEIYAESSLVMTDYSSACMDFALLRKPVVYCQFDEKEFFEKHTVKHGYFSYVEDGFGEVTYDMDSLVGVMISYMENGCRVHEPYGSRMDEFFAFHDHNNCERVYKKIKELDG